MVLRYVAAIVPPADILERVSKLREKLGDLKTAKVTQSPHIRVAHRGGYDPFAGWEPAMQELASKTNPFEIKLGEPEFLGEFLLAVPIISPELIRAHNESVKVITEHDELLEVRTEEEMQSFYESQSITTPYLTLATGVFGKEGFLGTNPMKKKILKEAKAALKGATSFTASELVLYEASIFGTSYDAKGIIQLGTQQLAQVPVDFRQPAIAA